jgi:hypothetical protein
MATPVAWPTRAELKQRLNVEDDDWDDQFDRVLAAAIVMTKGRVGDWDDGYDQPVAAVSQSALELAVELATTGPTPPGVSKSMELLYGHRRRFGIA